MFPEIKWTRNGWIPPFVGSADEKVPDGDNGLKGVGENEVAAGRDPGTETETVTGILTDG